jgi:predicted carbohydrate-binding protein with CBM5 and CBM33 domain
MILGRRMAVLAAAVVTAPLIAVVMPAGPASAHGWITNPPSRQDQCSTGAVKNCGGIQYEPQSVEAPKGAKSCSGGSSHTVLDNDNFGWKVTSIGSNASFTWRKTAMHRTTNWQYYVDGQLHQTISGNNAQPPQSVTHNITGLPNGRHKILAIWNIYDTVMAFYNCVDVNVTGGTTTTPPTQPTNPPPTGNCGTPWSASATYTKDSLVSHNGQKYKARWWTNGDTPSISTTWGVWEHQGAC